MTSDGTDTYAYDAENRLVSASGARNATLAYDPLGRLWQVTSGGSTTRFLYDGDALVAEYDGAGAMLRRHVHSVGADVPVITYEGASLSSPRFPFADERGSIVAMTDGNGVALTINSYDEYGIPGASNRPGRCPCQSRTRAGSLWRLCHLSRGSDRRCRCLARIAAFRNIGQAAGKRGVAAGSGDAHGSRAHAPQARTEAEWRSALIK